MKHKLSTIALVNHKSLLRTGFATVAMMLVTFSARSAVAQNPPSNQHNTIVFVCLHGSVKSQMAAAHFNRIARQRGLPYTAVSRGIAIDNSVPAGIREGLSVEGLAPTDDVPRELTAAEANGAVKVIAFDTVPDESKGNSEVTYWTDVPPATKNYQAARDAIVHHIDDLVPALALSPPVQETFRGIVASVNEWSDTLTIQLPSAGTTGDYKVQDGLIFNSVRYGDPVEITVETIDGARTITRLKKE